MVLNEQPVIFRDIFRSRVAILISKIAECRCGVCGRCLYGGGSARCTSYLGRTAEDESAKVPVNDLTVAIAFSNVVLCADVSVTVLFAVPFDQESPVTVNMAVPPF